MILETTYALTFYQIVVVAGALIALGGNYWLLIHIGKEGPELKKRMMEAELKVAVTETKVAEHKMEHKEKMEQFQGDIKEIKGDIKQLLQKR